MNDVAPALALRDLRFAWPGEAWRLSLPALTLRAGERMFLHGPSGSGKSTLLNLIAGTLRPQAGEVRVAGVDLAALPGHRRDRIRADRIGIVFQQFNLLPFLSMTENVLLPCRFSPLRRARAIERYGSLQRAADALLAHLGLNDPALQARPVMRLSVGQQQRVAAARALIGAPALVLADEPTSALDADAREDFLRLLFAECAAADAALLFVSHDLALRALFPHSLALNAPAAARLPEAA